MKNDVLMYENVYEILKDKIESGRLPRGDVYKRQGFIPVVERKFWYSREFLMAFKSVETRLSCPATVSYTHLDVYQRQLIRHSALAPAADCPHRYRRKARHPVPAEPLQAARYSGMKGLPTTGVWLS